MEFVKPTEAELAILHVLWNNGAQSVRFVNDILNSESDGERGYTSTLKTMQVMYEKGLLLFFVAEVAPKMPGGGTV